MLKSKKLNGSLVSVVILSVLLAFVTTTGLTLAWFSGFDEASENFTLGEAVNVDVTEWDGSEYVTSGAALKIESIGGENETLLPGMVLYPSFAATLSESNTRSLLRAEFIVTANGAANKTVEVATEIDADGEMTLSEVFTYELNQLLNGGTRHVLIPGTTTDYILADATVGTTTYARKVANGWSLVDGWWYYTGVIGDELLTITGTGAGLTVNYTNELDANVNTATTTTQMASINSDAAAVNVPFLTTAFTLPIFLNNDFANATITFELRFEAVQDYLIDPATYEGSATDRVTTSIANARAVFQDIYGA